MAPTSPDIPQSTSPPDDHDLAQYLEQMQSCTAVALSHNQVRISQDFVEQQMAERIARDGGMVKKAMHELWQKYLWCEVHTDCGKREFRKKIQDPESLYAVLSDDHAVSKNALHRLVDRLVSGDGDNAYAKASGEIVTTRNVTEQTELETAIRGAIKETVLRYVDGTIDEEALEQMQHDILLGLKEVMPNLFESSALLAGNLREIVHAALVIKDHIRGMDNAEAQLHAVLDSVSLTYVNARPGLSAEGYKTRFNNASERMRTKGYLMNSATGTAALALAISRVGAAVHAGPAGTRQTSVIKREAHYADREATVSGDISEGRLAEYLGVQHDRFSSASRMQVLQVFIDQSEPFSIGQAMAAMQAIAATREAIILGTEARRDLIQFSSRSHIDTERSQLLAMTDQIERRLKAQFTYDYEYTFTNPYTATDVGQTVVPEKYSFDECIERYRDLYGAQMDRNIQQSQARLHRLRSKKTAQGAVIGLIGVYSTTKTRTGTTVSPTAVPTQKPDTLTSLGIDIEGSASSRFGGRSDTVRRKSATLDRGRGLTYIPRQASRATERATNRGGSQVRGR